jgi:hypothetical protein
MSLNFCNFGERNQQEPIPKIIIIIIKTKRGEKATSFWGEVFYKQEELKPIFLMNI